MNILKTFLLLMVILFFGRVPLQAVEEGSSLLSAETALISGSAKLEGKGDQGVIGAWNNLEDSLQWTEKFGKPGIYSIDLTYSLASGNEGSVIEVGVGSQALEIKLESTGEWKQYKTISIGKVEIKEAGLTGIILYGTKKPGTYLMNFKSLTLHPTSDTQLDSPVRLATRRAILVKPLAEGPQGMFQLWYQQPARRWEEALPVGNGRLGAMVFGGTENERLQLNEDTLWAGGPYDPARLGAKEAIAEARKLVLAGKSEEATKLINEKGMANPKKQLPYQSMGDLKIIFPASNGEVTDYQRSLDLETAVVTTTYQQGGVTFTREVFSSAPDQVIVVRLKANKSGQIHFSASLSSPQRNVKVADENGMLSLTGLSGSAEGIEGQVRFNARLLAENEGGSVAVKGGKIEVEGADSVTLLLSAATSYVNWKDVSGDPVAKADKALWAASKISFDNLKSRHVEDYRSLFSRVSLNLPAGPNTTQPTDERVRLFAEGKDPQLAALFFQFGRYLLISSSRPGTQPANLQGIWNDSLSPSWQSKYTVNINTEMNYWPAETTNLAECHLPLIQMVKELSESGVRSAQGLYGARGWMVHHNTDAWRATGPIDWAPTGMWPMGGAWLCTHLWEHYQFSGDKKFLAEAYPLMKGACEYFLDVLVPYPQHPEWLVTCPSYSPENGPLTAGPAMDNQLLRDLFGQTAEAAQILGIDASFREQILSTRAKLPPDQIGRLGQLQEWLEDRDSPNDKNRHVSHLYGLFPSAQITEKTPDLFKAARKSLEFRGDAGTGWSLAWKINFWARLLDGDHAFLILSNQLSVPGSHGQTFDSGGGTFPNLFDAHPPFQIDGNFGAVSGIAEMLMQSHIRDTGSLGPVQKFEIQLLPALPSAWPEGSVRGLCARGGYEVDIEWKGGQLTGVILRNVSGSKTAVSYRDKKIELDLNPGESVQLDAELKKIGKPKA